MKKSRLDFYISQWQAVPPVETADLSAKTVLVVGANVGIGFEASKHFARMQPARLILACRSESKGKAAIAEIEKETSYHGCELRIVDLSEFSSVVAFADKFEKEVGDLHILVMNAGVLSPKYQLTTNGWESMIHVNHLATPLLSLLLIPKLVATGRKSSTPSRMVIVSSGVHHWYNPSEDVKSSSKPLETLNKKEWVDPHGMTRNYFASKTFNVFFVRALTDRLQSITPISAVAADPGFCCSQLRRAFYERFFSLAYIRVSIAELFLAWQPEVGSRQLVFAAVGEQGDLEKMKGAYVSRGRIVEVSDFLLSDEGHKMQDNVWNETITILSGVSDKIAPIVGEYLTLN